MALPAQTAEPQSLAVYKNWQVKGYARNALRMGDYYQARDYLREWHHRDSLNEEVIFNLGYSYYRIREYQKSMDYFSRLTEKSGKKQMESLYYYGLLQKHQGRYEIAIKTFQSLRRKKSPLTPNIPRTHIENLIAGCQLGIKSRDTVVKSEVLLLNESINTNGFEVGHKILTDSSFIYATKLAGPGSTMAINQPHTIEWHYFKALLNKGLWKGQFEIENSANLISPSGGGDGTYSIDGERYYQSICESRPDGKTICHLYVSYLHQGKWSQPVKIENKVNHRRYSSFNPTVGTCFDANLEVIYFVSNRPGGAGGYDIWFTLFNKKNNTFKQAENAGVFINTPYNEITPFYDLPSHCLLFSSDGWPGLGGLDVFMAKGELVSWEEPVNLKLPVNSSYDDMDFIRNESGRFGLLSSNRDGSNGLQENCCNDLYAYQQTESPRILVRGRLLKEDLGKKEDFFDMLSGKSSGLLPTATLKNQKLSIKLLTDSTSSLYLQETVTNENGEFEVWVDPNSNYQIKVNDNSLLDTEIEFSTKTLSQNQTLTIEPVLLNTIPETPIEVKDIYYEYDQHDLSLAAKKILDNTLFLLMKTYPNIRVEIGSHTDDKGEERYNLRLSQRRANNVVQYLVEKGIDINRMVAKGYGESQPVAPNSNDDGSDNPEGRQKNRRTEFRIISNEPLNIQ
jgi:outer membrane protein OmpA-like peptidoglycan-associated protein/tetratricopeptide (TPR) repeat protein